MKTLSITELRKLATPALDNPGNGHRLMKARRELAARLLDMSDLGVLEAMAELVQTHDRMPHADRYLISAPVMKIRAGLAALDGKPGR